MKKWILFQILFFLAIVSCQSSDYSIRQMATSDSILEATAAETAVEPKLESTATLAASSTATLIPTEASTATLPPTETIPNLETFTLPELTADEPVTITQIQMVDLQTGWAIGHQIESGDRILYTVDGGATWIERTPPIIASQPEGQLSEPFSAWAYFHDLETAWAITLQKYTPPSIQKLVVWSTQDGGQTWQPSQELPLTGTEGYFEPEGFSFINPMQGWLLVHVDAGMSHDYSNLYQTTDGGFTWNKLIDPYGEGLQALHNTGLKFSDAQLGWVTKDNLAVMPGAFLEQTLDGGLSWENSFLPHPAEIDWFEALVQCKTSSPVFQESEMGMVLVNCHDFEGQSYTYVYSSRDRGQNWQSVALPSPAESLIFINAQTGWAFGRDFFQSTDGGLSWVKIKTVNWDGQFSFVDAQTGWAVATNGEAIALVFTQDGGKSWQQLNPVITQKK